LLAPAWINTFERPVADYPWAPVAVLLARQDEAADRQLAALVVAVEQIDGQDAARLENVAAASTSVPPALASEAIVGQSAIS
jgi:hypothetical protein